MKYIVPVKTEICYYSILLKTWVGIFTTKEVVYTDDDIMFARSRAECRKKYGEVISDTMTFDDNFKEQRKKLFTYFLVPDNQRPIIEVRNSSMRVEE
jgi:hypothetical protein